MINGEGSCCSKLSKCWELREKDRKIYTEHMVISLSRVTETAVVCKSIFLCENDDFANIEAPPDDARQSVCPELYVSKPFNEVLSSGLRNVC